MTRVWVRSLKPYSRKFHHYIVEHNHSTEFACDRWLTMLVGNTHLTMSDSWSLTLLVALLNLYSILWLSFYIFRMYFSILNNIF